MLGAGTDHPTLVQYRSNALWVPALRMVGLVGAVQVPDNRDKITKSGVKQAGGKAIDRGPRGLDEVATQREIFHGVAGKHHLGE